MNLICSVSALSSLQRVLVRTRSVAYGGCASKTVGDIMDTAEYLTAILLNHEGLSEEDALTRFRVHLQDLEDRFEGFTGLVAAFDAERQTRSLIPAL